MLTRVRPLGFVASLACAALVLGSFTAWRATAAPDPNESTFVPVTPTRILDTRDPIDVGLDGPFVSPVSQKLRVTGTIPTTDGTQTVVPVGATGVALNVTVVLPTTAGFVSIRPGDATGAPATSSLNFEAGVVQPNAVTVELPTGGANAGMIDITYDAYGTAGPTTDVLIDVVGFTTNAGIQSLAADLATKASSADVYTRSETDAALATKANGADVYTKGETDGAFVAHGEITMGVGNHLHPNFGLPPTGVQHWVTRTVWQSGAVELDLPGPISIGGVEYGLARIGYCLIARTGDRFITRVEVHPDGPGGSALVVDLTDRSAPGCHEVAVNATGHRSYSTAWITGGSSGTVAVGGVTAVWAPADTLRARVAPVPEDDGGGASGN